MIKLPFQQSRCLKLRKQCTLYVKTTGRASLFLTSVTCLATQMVEKVGSRTCVGSGVAAQRDLSILASTDSAMYLERDWRHMVLEFHVLGHQRRFK